MDKVALKGLAACILFIISLTAIIPFFYETLKDHGLALIRGEDYIYYLPQLFPVMFTFPALVGFYISCVSILLFFPVRLKIRFILNKVFFLLAVYCAIAVTLGVITSFIVIIYPLGINYYKCDSTSVLSPGSHYARTKEMCKERKGWSNEQRRASYGKPKK